MEGSVTDYSAASLDEARRHPDALTRRVELADLLPGIAPGEFLVSHLGFNRFTREALGGFRVVVLQREIRATFVSHMRFIGETGRPSPGGIGWRSLPDSPEKTLGALSAFGSVHLDMCRRMLGWFETPGVLCLSFEELSGDCGSERAIAAILRLAAFCGIAGVDRVRAETVLATVIGRPTQTWSGQRTALDRFWDEYVEWCFRALDGPAVNHALGYAVAPWDGAVSRIPDAHPVRQSLRDRLNGQADALWRAAKSPRARWHIRLIAKLAIGYLVSPVDLIPDWIPTIGYLDDALVLRVAMMLVFRLNISTLWRTAKRLLAPDRVRKTTSAAEPRNP
jgi:uncharacterized membrane protein YkvA (DUF1232 family)